MNIRRTRRLVDQWRTASPDTGIFRHEFPTAENISILPDACTDKINAVLMRWLTAHAGLEERLHPSFSGTSVAD